MNSLQPDRAIPTHPHHRARRELILSTAALAFGLFVLPALIYGVGAALLGPYGENRGMGAFYIDFFRDLAEPSGRAWAIALGPLALVAMFRAIFLGVKPSGPEPQRAESKATPPPRAHSESHRVEPRVSLD